MEEPTQFKTGDLVKLTTGITVKDPLMGTDETEPLPRGWTRRLIGFSPDGEYALLEYRESPLVTVPIPIELITPA